MTSPNLILERRDSSLTSLTSRFPHAPALASPLAPTQHDRSRCATLCVVREVTRTRTRKSLPLGHLSHSHTLGRSYARSISPSLTRTRLHEEGHSVAPPTRCIGQSHGRGGLRQVDIIMHTSVDVRARRCRAARSTGAAGSVAPPRVPSRPRIPTYRAPWPVPSPSSWVGRVRRARRLALASQAAHSSSSPSSTALTAWRAFLRLR